MFSNNVGDDLGLKTIESGGMIMNWSVQEDHINIELLSPRQGWVAVGFNNSNALKGSMLLMARVRNGKAEVVEHYVIAAGNYQPAKVLGSSPIVTDISGSEDMTGTSISFKLPLDHSGPHHIALVEGRDYFVHLAYSLDDDFQHHSISRTLEQLTL